MASSQEVNQKKLIEIKSLDELDFDKMEALKGKTPEDIEERCLQLCRDYLGEQWIHQTVDNIEVRRLSGGFINQLYYCAIRKSSSPVMEDNKGIAPHEVAIRLFGKKLLNNAGNDDNENLSDIIIGLL